MKEGQRKFLSVSVIQGYYWRDLIEEDTDGDFRDGTSFQSVIERFSFVLLAKEDTLGSTLQDLSLKHRQRATKKEKVMKNNQEKKIKPQSKNKKDKNRYSKFKKRFHELQSRRKKEASMRISEFHEETICVVCGYKASSRESLVKHFLESIKLGSKLHERNIKSTGFNIKINLSKPHFASIKSKLYDPDTSKVSVRTISNGIETNRRRH